jgi:asparagine synthase (glutamine-hydrolysing)
MLSGMASGQGLKVVLAGQGADEIFAGYVGYRFDQFRQSLPRRADANALSEAQLRKHIWGDENFFYEKDYHAFRQLAASLYSTQVRERVGGLGCFAEGIINKERIFNLDPVHRRSYIDYKLRLCDHLLSDHGDRMTFANSVECRYPFLDQDLIEFARVIPPALKLKDYEEKYILKKMAGRLLPQEIIRREKFGFTAPGSPCLLKQGLEYVNDLLSPSRIKREGYFNPDTVDGLKKRYMEPGFRVNVPFDDDLLIVVITFGVFLETFDLPALN